MLRLRSTALVSSTVLATALLVAGCDSQIHMTGSPAIPPSTSEAGVRALVSAGAAGQVVTIDNPQLLPESVRNAGDLKAAFGGVKVPVTRTPGGYYTFAIPANAKVQTDLSGNMHIVFIIDDTRSQIVTLNTGSPVSFAQPPVLTDPSPAFLPRGLKVKLSANTQASTETYQFTWSYGQSAQGPWMPIPGQGKDVEWTPPAAGNYFIKVDAVERASQRTYSTITPAAVVFVTDAKGVITTEPVSGSVQRGNEIKLNFVKPAALKGEHFNYAWSYGPSAQGPFTPISGNEPSINWLPTGVGSYFVRAEVTNRDTGEVYTFISPEAAVFVSEGKPIVQPSSQTAERGDQISLALGANLGEGPFTWYWTTGNAQSGPWNLLSGTGKTIDFITTNAGAYNFRVDVPQTGGGIKSFTTTEPVLNVIERTPIIQTVPANDVIQPGGSTTFQLNARGIDPDKYRLVWFVSQGPAGPWSATPNKDTAGDRKKTYTWSTAQQGNPANPAGTAVGTYYVRVDAYERNGTGSYSFVSSGPVVTVER